MKRRAVALVLVSIALGGCSGRDEAEQSADADDGSSLPQDDAPSTRIVAPALTYDPARVGLCTGAPADLFGAPVWVDARGAWLGPRRGSPAGQPVQIATWRDGEEPRSPVVNASGIGPALIIATREPDHCTLHFFDRRGAALSTLEAPASDCISPSSAGRMLIWPLAGDGGSPHRVEWIDLGQDMMWTVELDAAPTTSIVAVPRVDSLSGGGSHWLVGTELGVVAIHDDNLPQRLGPDTDPIVIEGPELVGTWSESEGVPSSIVAARARRRDAGDLRDLDLKLAVVTLRGASSSDAGLGARIRVLRMPEEPVDGFFEASGEIIEAPSALTAHPVALASCRSVAGGGSHWFCPDTDDLGAVVAAGEGWISAWGLPSGRVAFEHEDTITWTGLAVGSGGWIAGGGSHWLPAPDGTTWTLRALHPGAVGAAIDTVDIELAAGGGDAACVSSPLWDTDGALVAPVITSAATVVAHAQLGGVVQGLALGHGFTRPLGGNLNTGLSTIDPGACPDGTRRDVHVEPMTGFEMNGVVGVGDGICVYGTREGRGFIKRLLPNATTTVVEIPETTYVDGVVPISTGSATPPIAATWIEPGDGTATLRVAGFDMYTPGTPLWTHGEIFDLAAFGGFTEHVAGRFMVAARLASTTLFVVDPAQGFVASQAFPFPDEPYHPERLLADQQGGAILVQIGSDGLRFLRVSGELVQLDEAIYAVPGTNIAPVSITVDGAGEVRAFVEAVVPEGGGEAHWVHFDRNLDVISDRTVPFIAMMATRADGSSLLNAVDGLVRIGPAGHIGLTRPFGSDLSLYGWRGGVVPSPTGFIASWQRFGDVGYDLVWARVDALGFATCSAPGLCLGTPIAGCDVSVDACVASGCDPATGACTTAPIVGCVP